MAFDFYDFGQNLFFHYGVVDCVDYICVVLFFLFCFGGFVNFCGLSFFFFVVVDVVDSILAICEYGNGFVGWYDQDC